MSRLLVTGIYRFFFNGPLTLNSYIGKYIIFAPIIGISSHYIIINQILSI